MQGDARQITSDRVDVREVHRRWIVDLLAEFVRRMRGNRADNRIDLFKRLSVVASNQRPDFLCL